MAGFGSTTTTRGPPPPAPPPEELQVDLLAREAGPLRCQPGMKHQTNRSGRRFTVGPHQRVSQRQRVRDGADLKPRGEIGWEGDRPVQKRGSTDVSRRGIPFYGSHRTVRRYRAHSTVLYPYRTVQYTQSHHTPHTTRSSTPQPALHSPARVKVRASCSTAIRFHIRSIWLLSGLKAVCDPPSVQC